jgi:hypothetical protein
MQSCIFQSIDLNVFDDEIALDQSSPPLKNRSKPPMYKKVKHIDFFLQNEMQLIATLNHNHITHTNILAYEHYTNFLHTFSSYSSVKMADLDFIPVAGNTNNPPNYGLFHYDATLVRSPKLLSYISSNSTHPLQICTSLINTFKSALNAIIYLKINNVVHLGLSNDAFIVTDGVNSSRTNDGMSHVLINAQYAFFTKDIYDPDKIAKIIEHAGHVIYPLEHAVFLFMHQNKSTSLSAHNVEIIVSSFIKHHSTLNKMSAAFCKDYHTQCTSALARYINAPKMAIAEIIFNDCYTWNVFSLSMIFLNIVLSIFPDKALKQGFANKWLKLLLLNIHPDTKKRKTAEETSAIFSKLCYQNTLQDFEAIFNTMSY